MMDRSARAANVVEDMNIAAKLKTSRTFVDEDIINCEIRRI
jgi:hypothetical protein